MTTSATHVIDSEIRPHVEASDWEGPKPGEDNYGPNQVIAAFNVGVATGIERAQKAISALIEKNLERAGNATRKVIEKLQESGFHPSAARLRINEWDYFEVMLLVTEADTLQEAFGEMLDYMTEVEQEEQDYCLVFHFCGVTEHFNEARMAADGYVWFHKALSNEPATR